MNSKVDPQATVFDQFAFKYEADSRTCTIGMIKRMSYGEVIDYVS